MHAPIDPEQQRFANFCVFVCAFIGFGMMALCLATALCT